MKASYLLQVPTPTPPPPGFWATPTRVPTSVSLPLDFSNAVPTLVENYARSAEYGVQAWNTFTDPVHGGVDALLVFFTIGIILFGLWRIYRLAQRATVQREVD